MPNWDSGSGWIGSGQQEPGFFRDFRDRLSAASANEEARIAGLQRDAQLQGERQLANQYGQAIGLGYGAAQGGGPAALRGAAYGAGSMRQQQSNDAAMMKAVQDQAFRQAYLDMLNRRGANELGAAGLATQGYGLGQDRMAAGMEASARDNAQEAQGDANTAGVALGTVGSVLGAAGRVKSDKEYKQGVEDGRAQVEDATLAALRRREVEVQQEKNKNIRATLAGPPGSALRGLYESVGAVQRPARTGAAGATAAAAADTAPQGRGIRKSGERIPVREPVTFTMQRPGTVSAGTYGYDPMRREFTPDVPGAVVLPAMEVKSDPRFKQNIRPTSGRAEDMTAAELGLALDVEDARMGQRLRAQGPVVVDRAPMRPEEFDQTLSASEGKTYEYTPRARAQYPDQTRGGDLYGPMADSLRQTSVGRSMLTPDGKAIDIQGATVGNLGLSARLHDRLSAVEQALGIEDANTTRKLRAGGPVRTR